MTPVAVGPITLPEQAKQRGEDEKTRATKICDRSGGGSADISSELLGAHQNANCPKITAHTHQTTKSVENRAFHRSLSGCPGKLKGPKVYFGKRGASVLTLRRLSKSFSNQIT
jgi:hypothetical protein